MIDRKILRRRLTADHLIKDTEIFATDLGGDPATIALVEQRFRDYWNAWIKDDVDDLLKDPFEIFAKASEKLRAQGMPPQVLLDADELKTGMEIYTEKLHAAIVGQSFSADEFINHLWWQAEQVKYYASEAKYPFRLAPDVEPAVDLILEITRNINNPKKKRGPKATPKKRKRK